ncbi:MAG TPA: hypothetical protein PKA31_02355 [Candidatus Moranbacteria bacterium]|nr:hypothetical protein [Candidatus Moranbacteria bacterium]
MRRNFFGAGFTFFLVAVFYLGGLYTLAAKADSAQGKILKMAMGAEGNIIGDIWRKIAHIFGEETYAPFTAMPLGVVTLAAAALILTLVFRRSANSLAALVEVNFWGEWARGLAMLILIPLAAALLALSGVGALVSLVVILAFACMFLVSAIGAGIILGSFVSKVFKRTETLEVSWVNAMGGTVILAISGYLPFFGWALWAVFLLTSLGALGHLVYNQLRMEH